MSGGTSTHPGDDDDSVAARQDPMSTGTHWASTEWWGAVSQARMLAEQVATHDAARRLVLANALCSELIASEGHYAALIVGAAYGLYKEFDDGGYQRRNASRINLAYAPREAEDYVAAELPAARVAAALGMLYTADYSSEYESDSRRVTEGLRDWLMFRTVVLPADGRVAAEYPSSRPARDAERSKVQQVANMYAENAASVDDVLAVIAAAHETHAESRAAVRSDTTGTVAELDSWYGIVSRSDDLSFQLDGRLAQLRRVYGPFASDHGWVVQPAIGVGSNRDPDNPFYRPDPEADYMPYEIAGVLYGVGLNSLDTLLRAMAYQWNGSDEGERGTDNSGGVDAAARSVGLDRTGQQLVSPYFIGGLLAEGKLDLDLVEDFGERFTQLIADPSVASVGVAISFICDMDGGRHAVVVASDADMEGWKLRTATRSGDLVTYFEKAAVRAEQGIRYVEVVPADAWTAWSDWDFTSTSLITPGGEELLLPTREACRRY
jgi:hypothetical protein